MLQFLKTWRRWLIAAALVLLTSLIWISNSKRERDRNFVDRTVVTLTAPLESAVSAAIRGVQRVWYGYFALIGVREEHERLLREKEELEGKLARANELEVDNERLREMLAFERETPGELLPATVIGADSASHAKSLRINRGTRHGVGRNMAVVTPAGVVGRVVETSWLYSDVQLVTDGRSAVPVRVQRTRARGVLAGLSKGICHLDYVARSEDVQPGDVVITSGLGGIYPPGLIVGTVVAVEKKEFGVLQDVRVAPAVDFQRFPEEVLVVLEVEEPPPPEVAATPVPPGAPAVAARGGSGEEIPKPPPGPRE